MCVPFVFRGVRQLVARTYAPYGLIRECELSPLCFALAVYFFRGVGDVAPYNE